MHINRSSMYVVYMVNTNPSRCKQLCMAFSCNTRHRALNCIKQKAHYAYLAGYEQYLHLIIFHHCNGLSECSFRVSVLTRSYHHEHFFYLVIRIESDDTRSNKVIQSRAMLNI